MSKSGNPQSASKPIQNQILEHDIEVLKFLHPDANTCAFQAEAAALASHGLLIHPLKPRDKAPLLKGWLSKATTNPGMIEQWAEDYPTANVGIIPGPASGIIVMDCDLRRGADASLQQLKQEHGELPLTWSVLTPNGWHFYFKHPGGDLRSYNSFAPGIEIKSAGSNIVGPGSLHPNGLAYRWQPACSPDEVALAEAPQWLLERLRRKGKWTAQGAMCPVIDQVNILGAPLVLGEGTGQAESLKGADVLSLFSQESTIKKILPLLGLGEVEIGEKFRCVLHPEKRASASILRPEREGDPFMYMDFHEREPGRRAFPLPLVYYYLKRGKPGERIKPLPKPTFFVWALRLLRDAGVIDGVKVQPPRLPDSVKAHVRKVYEGFGELLSLKYLVERVGSPYTWEFIGSWVGVPKKAAGWAMRWLVGSGYIRCVGHFGSEEAGNRVQLFTLGTRRLVQRLSGRAMLDQGGQTAIIEAVEAEVAVLEREQQAEAQAQREPRWCQRCGEWVEWVRFEEEVTCLSCWGTMPEPGPGPG
ncbi:MAG: hypothetical protein ETSY1_46195 (plasmid) [Candidatus Entotheonella factor]|uniref:DNA primase/polymerase bifunctional N-terminal domain-containing protein n=1 Tax=Entotheonella factor TaxID=1429438 RepID=W4M1D2_ENTF1|nr:MAG: hypothetical protein ETSY1_46195 [Candidatus Entotheonella factor]